MGVEICSDQTLSLFSIREGRDRFQSNTLLLPFSRISWDIIVTILLGITGINLEYRIYTIPKFPKYRNKRRINLKSKLIYYDTIIPGFHITLLLLTTPDVHFQTRDVPT